jgi:hypothetical protein
MKKIISGAGILGVSLWAASLVVAFRIGSQSAEQMAAPATLSPAKTPMGISAASAAPVDMANVEQVVFSPDDRPSWDFSPRMDAGRRMVLSCLLKDANSNELLYAEKIFGGLDEGGRQEALAALSEIDSLPLREASFQVLFREWAAEDPESAVRVADALKETPGGLAAVATAWATFLEQSPAMLSNALEAWPAPGDWEAVMLEIGNKSGELGDYETYSGLLRDLSELELCDARELRRMTMRLRGERMGTTAEALELFSRMYPEGGDEAMSSVFSFHMGAYFEQPEELDAIASYVASVEDASMRAGMITGMGEAWLTRDPDAALASTDLLPEGLRERVHSELFEQLIEVDQESAANYFNQMPVGELRDHLLASSSEGWIEEWGRESLLNQVPYVESEAVVLEMLNSALRSMRSYWPLNDSNPIEMDSSITQLLDAQEYIPGRSRREAYLLEIYSHWAGTGAGGLDAIVARLNGETFLSPDERQEMLETVSKVYTEAEEFREKVRQNRKATTQENE